MGGGGHSDGGTRSALICINYSRLIELRLHNTCIVSATSYPLYLYGMATRLGLLFRPNPLHSRCVCTPCILVIGRVPHRILPLPPGPTPFIVGGGVVGVAPTSPQMLRIGFLAWTPTPTLCTRTYTCLYEFHGNDILIQTGATQMHVMNNH